MDTNTICLFKLVDRIGVVLFAELCLVNQFDP